VKIYLFLIAVVVTIACIFGLTKMNHTTHQMVDHTQSVNAIIDEASR